MRKHKNVRREEGKQILFIYLDTFRTSKCLRGGREVLEPVGGLHAHSSVLGVCPSTIIGNIKKGKSKKDRQKNLHRAAVKEARSTFEYTGRGSVPDERCHSRVWTAVLHEGHAIVNLDNIEHPLCSPDPGRAITQAEYQDRTLGENKTLRVPPNLLWTATGNNLVFRGDLSVRALLSRLDANLERPEEHHFRIDDLKAYIMQDRDELVTAALTILRAYPLAGRPDE